MEGQHFNFFDVMVKLGVYVIRGEKKMICFAQESTIILLSLVLMNHIEDICNIKMNR